MWEDTPFEGKGRDSAVMILLKKLAKLKGDDRPEGVARLKHPRMKYVPVTSIIASGWVTTLLIVVSTHTYTYF